MEEAQKLFGIRRRPRNGKLSILSIELEVVYKLTRGKGSVKAQCVTDLHYYRICAGHQSLIVAYMTVNVTPLSDVSSFSLPLQALRYPSLKKVSCVCFQRQLANGKLRAGLHHDLRSPQAGHTPVFQG
jgi:hypothetical protein